MKLLGLATLGRDAEVRFTANGDAVAGFSVAYNYGRKDTGGNQPSQWVKCSLWGKRAESLAPYLLKGKQFYIELSDVHIETYESDKGSGVNLVGRVDNIEFTRGGGDQDGQQRQESAPRGQANQEQRNGYADAKGRSQPAPSQSASLADMDDDIPF